MDCMNYFSIMFQYISCYSLSNSLEDMRFCRKSFNTSHVTLYPFSGGKYGNQRNVSIHLMLLFIQLLQQNLIFRRGVSIHLMLLFITLEKLDVDEIHIVSIHLMLLFICLKARILIIMTFVSIHLMLLFIYGYST